MMILPYSNTKIKHWNPGATMPLILPVHLICNTPDDVIYENIKANSITCNDWVRAENPHEGIAILCGSGPSIADSVDEIKKWRDKGAKIFALNNAARFLADNGIVADYQLLIDARKETAGLIGPAKEHLFASQVHPDCFKNMPTARLWHLQVENMDSLLPEYEKAYCLIGGAASIGNTATCLAYAMGYRKLHLYGYDSSNRGDASHVIHQKINDGEPMASVRFNGKDYISSLTMKLQAEKFQETSRALMAEGCEIYVHGEGLLPDMFNTVNREISEREKYEMMWDFPEYRTVAPGEEKASFFCLAMNPQPGDSVIDFGSGTGRGALRIHKMRSCDVTMLDFAQNSLDEIVRKSLNDKLKFEIVDLTNPIPFRAKFGYCTDVMEHIPQADIDLVILNIMQCVDKTFFQISTVNDVMGELINLPLHLSVHPHEWWKKKFLSLGFRVNEVRGSVSESIFIVYKGDL